MGSIYEVIIIRPKRKDGGKRTRKFTFSLELSIVCWGDGRLAGRDAKAFDSQRLIPPQ